MYTHNTTYRKNKARISSGGEMFIIGCLHMVGLVNVLLLIRTGQLYQFGSYGSYFAAFYFALAIGSFYSAKKIQ